jgi:lipoate-protein ligase A
MTSLAGDDSPSVRILVDEQPSSGAWNMAVDELLLDAAVSSGRCSLRWYRWEEPTLSLGYFQRPDDPLIADRFAELPRVRRLSGGGAILHDQELTYSCALGAGHPLAGQPSAVYERIHAAIIGVLADFGISLQPRGRAALEHDSNFLCFHRHDANDLVYGADKVLGSAQRRRRGAVLQHGSLVLKRSPVAPEFPGILDLCNDPPTEAALLPALIDATALVLGDRKTRDTLTEQELRSATEIARRADAAVAPNSVDDSGLAE